jgi:hypothetical protein
MVVECLTTEAVKGPSLALECVHYVHGSHGLATSVLSVGNGVTDDVLEENLKNSTGLLVDETGDALDTATACETADGGLGDALDVVPEDLTVALGASLAESLSSLSATRLREREREAEGRVSEEEGRQSRTRRERSHHCYWFVAIK